MPGFSADQVHERADASYDAVGDAHTTNRQRKVAPIVLAGWLQERVPRLRELWGDELRDRHWGGHADDGVVEQFITLLVGLLPHMLEARRDVVQPLWVRAADLFGRTAAKRGLAAGEVIEELNLLRELVIRELYRDPPHRGRRPLSLREVLRLNRALDGAVTHASVGHTDTMFFQFFEGNGTSPHLSEQEIVDETEAQLEAIRQEFQEIQDLKERARTTPSTPSTGVKSAAKN